MRKRKISKALALALGMTLVTGGIPMEAKVSVVQAEEATAVKDVNLNIDGKIAGITEPGKPDSNEAVWGNGQGSYIYFGDYAQKQDGTKEPVLWRVLDPSSDSDGDSQDDSMLLLSDRIVDCVKFNENTTDGNVWESSSIRKWLNTDQSGFFATAFEQAEKDVIWATTKAEGAAVNYLNSPALNSDQLFILSAAELENEEYGFKSVGTTAKQNNTTKLNPTEYAKAKGVFTSGDSGYWWLRSASSYGTKIAGVVDYDGWLFDDTVNDDMIGVSPAMHLDFSTILFTTAAGTDKTTFQAVGSQNANAQKWKLTLKKTDTEFQAYQIWKEEVSDGTSSNRTVTIAHSAANELEGATQLSGMLVNAAGEALYYGRINEDTSATETELELSKDLAAGEYTLYVFAEEVNGEGETDYASAFSTPIELVVSEEVQTEQIKEVGINGVTVPTAGEELDTTAECTTDGVTISELTWKKDGQVVNGKAEFNTTYEVSVTLTPAENYAIADTVNVSIEGMTKKGSVKNDDRSVTIFYEYTTPKAKLLEEIKNPEAVKEIENGTKLSEITLPDTIEIKTEDEQVNSATVSWNLEEFAEGSYDPNRTDEQTFKLKGTVDLEAKGIDADGKSNEVVIEVMVKAAETTQQPTTNAETTEQQTSEQTTQTATENRTTEITTEGQTATENQTTEITTEGQTTTQDRTTEITTEEQETTQDRTTQDRTTEKTTELTTEEPGTTQERTTEITTEGQTTAQDRTTEKTTEITTEEQETTQEKTTELTTEQETTQERTTTKTETTEKTTELTTEAGTTEKITELTTEEKTTTEERTTGEKTTEDGTTEKTTQLTTEERQTTEKTTQRITEDKNTTEKTTQTITEEQSTTEKTTQQATTDRTTSTETTTQAPVTEAPNAVTKVTVTPDIEQITVGSSVILIATVEPAAANQTVIWSSSNADVATVDANGKVMAKSEGLVVIKATSADGKKTGECLLTVKPVAEQTVAVKEVALNTDLLDLTIGAEAVLQATISPSNAGNQSVVWSSTNSAVATVDEVTGKIKAISEGVTIITVTTVDGGKSADCIVTVKEEKSSDIAVTGIFVQEKEIELKSGESKKLEVNVEPENATNKEVGYKSSDDSIVLVDSNGEITARKEGTAVIIITSKDGAKTAYVLVNVASKNSQEQTTLVKTITLNQDKVELTKGESCTLIASVSPENATNKELLWSSNDENVLRVDNTGKITAIAEGVATVIVQSADGGSQTYCTVTVKEKVQQSTETQSTEIAVTGISVNPSAITLNLNKTKTIETVVKPENATNKKITYRSSNTAVATVSSSGKVKAVAPGIATIYVKAGSIEKKVTVKVKPAKVTSLKKKILSKTKIKLTWKKQNQVTGYKVYRYNAKTKTYKLYKITKKNYVSVANLKNNTIYRFKVKAYKRSGSAVVNGEPSKVYMVKMKK